MVVVSLVTKTPGPDVVRFTWRRGSPGEARRAPGRQRRDRQAERPVTAAEIDGAVVGPDLEMLKQQARALVDGPRGEESPGAPEVQLPALEGLAEVDVLAEFVEGVVIEWHAGTA